MQTNDSAPHFSAGLIGSDIQQSLTPAMHMTEGRAHGFVYDYELMDINQRGGGVELLPQLLDEAERRGFAGVNVTHPFKQQVIPLLNSLSDDAAKLQAVNTVVFKQGQRIGHNTDWWGFSEGLKRKLPDADLANVVQLGAGGAGAATAFATLKLGAEALTFFDSDPTRAEHLAKAMRSHFPNADIRAGGDLEQAMARASGLVHATPTGMARYPGLPLPAHNLHPSLWVAEIVYFPLETALLIEARRRGCAVADGGGMAVFQAVGAFSLFTGVQPDAERMAAHFKTLTGTDAADIARATGR